PMPLRGQASHHALVHDGEPEVAVNEKQRRTALGLGRGDEGIQPGDGDALRHVLTKIREWTAIPSWSAIRATCSFVRAGSVRPTGAGGNCTRCFRRYSSAKGCSSARRG